MVNHCSDFKYYDLALKGYNKNLKIHNVNILEKKNSYSLFKGYNMFHIFIDLHKIYFTDSL